jgi:hypothetical protein
VYEARALVPPGPVQQAGQRQDGDRAFIAEPPGRDFRAGGVPGAPSSEYRSTWIRPETTRTGVIGPASSLSEIEQYDSACNGKRRFLGTPFGLLALSLTLNVVRTRTGAGKREQVGKGAH